MVTLSHINKRFGKVRAVSDVSLRVEAGAIHGLVGENGAGKTTLMRILSGTLQSDGGEIFLGDRPAKFKRPADALRAGVGMLHQDPLDFPPLTVLDNFLLGQRGRFFQNRSGAQTQLDRYLRQFGFDLALDALVSTLTVGERQQLEIVRLLSLGARILILDEPTTGISLPQKTKLFETLRRLAEQGITVILVTHKLRDVGDLCQRVTVMRLGKVVGEVTRPFTPDQLVHLMFGQRLPARTHKSVVTGGLVLELKNLCLAESRVHLPNINLKVHAGEVVGLAGIEGSGQRPFLRTCAGLDNPTTGGIWIGGEKLSRQPYQKFLDRGVAYLPAGRLEEGLVPNLTVTEHFILAQRSTGYFVNWTAAQNDARSRIAQHHIRGEPGTLVSTLSGGNQQRLLLSLLPKKLELLLLEHPTRGLDIESALWVWGQLLERCHQGTAIVFVSTDLDEIFEYSNRLLVFSDGCVSQLLNTSETTPEYVGGLMGGQSDK